MRTIERMRVWTQTAAVCCMVGGIAASAHAADARLQGAWRISAPQSAFKPEGGAVPFTDIGRQSYERNKQYQAKSNYDEYDYTLSRCASPGMPRLMLTPARFRIYERKGYVQISFEWNRLIRQIAMPELPTQQEAMISTIDSPRALGSARGDSKGHWEDNTLVVVTDNFTDTTLIGDLVPHGYGMKVTERLRLKDANTLENRIRIDDPEYFTRPWDTVVTYKRTVDTAFPEDVCLNRVAAGQPALPR